VDKANRICGTLINRAVAAHQSFDFVETRYTEESPNFHLRASASKKVAGNARTPEPCSQELWFGERCEQRRFFPKGKKPPSFLERTGNLGSDPRGETAKFLPGSKNKFTALAVKKSSSLELLSNQWPR
jgi:hypothetical protein